MQVEAAPGGLGCHWGVGLGGWGVTGVSARLAGCDSDAQAQLEPQRVLFLEQITYANTQMEIKKKMHYFLNTAHLMSSPGTPLSLPN